MIAANDSVLWPIDRLGEAMATLAHAADLHVLGAEALESLPRSILKDGVPREALERWVDASARALKLESEPLPIAYGDIENALQAPGASLLLLFGATRVAALVRVKRTRVTLIAPDGSRKRVSIFDLCAAIRSGAVPAAEARVDELLERAGVSGERRAIAKAAILTEQLSQRWIDIGFRLSLAPGASFARQLRAMRMPRRVSNIAILQAASQIAALLAWWVVGKAALDGRLELGWLLAWGLLLVTAIPIRLLASYQQGIAAIDFATLLKRRLLFGALRLEPEEMRNQGTGQLLGRVIESEAMESMMTNGGLASLLAIVQIVIAVAVLAAGPGGALTTILFVAWIAAMTAVTWRYFVRLRAWATTRLDMTNDLVERMVGHRTRLAQESRETWHESEDEQLSQYAHRSAEVDRLNAVLSAIVPRGWLVVGFLSMAPAFIANDASAESLAVGLGGLILAMRALSSLSSGAGALFGAQIAWRAARPLFEAASREEPVGRASLFANSAGPKREGAMLETRELSFSYRGRREPILRGVNLRVFERDRLLLQGASGGGKSTLGAVLTGVRSADSGLLLLGGLDRQTLGSVDWRRRIVSAPQFHENHVVSATLAFNLLMGRRWPPREKDLNDAAAVCDELGLGALVSRMPGGLMQMVGETGWQLSHGERSRLFIARALLQNAEMIVLDESFAALDPKSLETALSCVLSRAPALLVIAHP